MAFWMYPYIQRNHKAINEVVAYVNQASQQKEKNFNPVDVWIEGNKIAVNKISEIVITTTNKGSCKAIAEALTPSGEIKDSCSVGDGNLIFERNI